jgi:ribosomal protein L11 methyltransferase
MHSSKLGLEEHRHSFDAILANILAKPLIDLSDMMIKLLAPGGKIVLSGILEEQAGWVAESYKELSFGKTLVKQGWARLEAEKVEQNLRL